MSGTSSPFSFETRRKAISRLGHEQFDFLVVGGGITGAAVARDAASRGFKVALVEKADFASGTSSRSSKLVHGGLRYLENLEFKLVFEALAERTRLLKTAPHMVRPLPFYMPVYQGDAHGKRKLSLGLWLYDLLALFRAPGFHKFLSSEELLKKIPFLKKAALEGGFSYYDAKMWDDVLAVEVLRSASNMGVAIANYVEAVAPIWKEDQIVGFTLRDSEGVLKDFEINAYKTIVCAGPWLDRVGEMITPNWRPWLSPSKGIHLVFDRKKISLPGAVVMSHPTDGRISFVIPRDDYGAGVVIVGTTDGPTDKNPEKAEVSSEDVDYLMKLLERYFPHLDLKSSDILSAYVGVRPLMGPSTSTAGSEGQKTNVKLSKVSREHHIDEGAGGTVFVAGGKYTTHRTMAEEIVDFTIHSWKKDVSQGRLPIRPRSRNPSRTKEPINPLATLEQIEWTKREVEKRQWPIPGSLVERRGREALEIFEIHQTTAHSIREEKIQDPEGFPFLESQLRFEIRHGMVMHLEDFYFRREPLFMSRQDHGLPWSDRLALVWAEEMGVDAQEAQKEKERLLNKIDKEVKWFESFH